jgi:hypothetical protein
MKKISWLTKYKESLYLSLSRDLSEFEKNFLLITGGNWHVRLLL